MSQENVEILRRVFRDANEGDLESVVAAYAEGAVLYAPEDWPESGPGTGARRSSTSSAACGRTSRETS